VTPPGGSGPNQPAPRSGARRAPGRWAPAGRADLVALRARAFAHAVRRAPGRYLVGTSLMGLVAWGTAVLVDRGVRWVDAYPLIGTIADAALRRSVEAFVTVLVLAVAFSVLTTAITTLYTAADLPLLLSWPLPAERVFRLKVFETYLASAALPALLTLPVLVGLGTARGAPWSYYPQAVVAVLALYALPVTVGALLALLLMRLAPAGRVKEVATAASVLLAAGLVVGLRALRPEQLAELTPEEFEAFLAGFASLDLGASPATWAGDAIWNGLSGGLSPALPLLALVAWGSLAALGRVAAWAYQVGWVRSLDGSSRPRDPRPRPAASWERPLERWGGAGAVVVKDLRLLMRDPTQWSQLLVLVALAGVYLVSTASLEVEGQRFRDALGTLNVAFLGFLLAGVGVRLAFPVVSLEGEGLWFLRSGPIGATAVLGAKFAYAMPPLLLLGLGLGFAQATLLDVSANLASASIVAGGLASIAVTGLGVGLGAAYPRYDATQAAEVPVSPGGLLYMTLALLYAAGLTLLLAYPAWTTVVDPTVPVWSTAAGRVTGALAGAWTAAFAGGALAFGRWRFVRYEPGRD
jgi:ABC-2 type transport system permease protein